MRKAEVIKHCLWLLSQMSYWFVVIEFFVVTSYLMRLFEKNHLLLSLRIYLRTYAHNIEYFLVLRN